MINNANENLTQLLLKSFDKTEPYAPCNVHSKIWIVHVARQNTLNWIAKAYINLNTHKVQFSSILKVIFFLFTLLILQMNIISRLHEYHTRKGLMYMYFFPWDRCWPVNILTQKHLLHVNHSPGVQRLWDTVLIHFITSHSTRHFAQVLQCTCTPTWT